VGLTTTTVSPNTVGYASYDVVDMAPGVPASSYERPTLTGFSTLFTTKATSLRSAGSDNDPLSRGWLVPPVMCVALYHMTTTPYLPLGPCFHNHNQNQNHNHHHSHSHRHSHSYSNHDDHDRDHDVPTEWKKKRTRRLQKKRRKMRQRSK